MVTHANLSLDGASSVQHRKVAAFMTSSQEV